MSLRTAISLLLALASTILTNLAYSREHDAAAKLPALSMRRPAHSLMLLLADRSWMSGFMLESGGFALYAVALGLGSLALVQSVAAGGIGVLAFVSARAAHRALRGVDSEGSWCRSSVCWHSAYRWSAAPSRGGKDRSRCS